MRQHCLRAMSRFRPRLLAMHRIAAVVGVLLALALRSGLADVAAPDVKDWQITDSGIQLIVDLDGLRARMKEDAPALARQQVPALLQDFDWFNFRFSSLRVQLDDVAVQPGAAANEARVRLSGGVEANRERLAISWRGLRWEPNGGKRVVNLTVDARIRLAVSPAGAVTVTVLGDSIRAESLLSPIHGAAVTQPLSGRTLREQMITAIAAHLPKQLDGVRFTDVRFSRIDPSEAAIDVTIAVE
jgi:hypothetical protein